MPTDQLTASDREADLQRICHAVLNESVSTEGPTSAFDFAKAVARRYAATVGAVGWRRITDADKAYPSKSLLLIARYPKRLGWTDAYTGWWEAQARDWARWPHQFPPTHCMDVAVPSA